MRNFYKCDDCDVVMLEMNSSTSAEKIKNLTLMTANSTDAATEKHVPVAKISDGKVFVSVGSEAHPMTPEHYIEWIYIKTSFGGIFRKLNPTDPPEALFNIEGLEVQQVFAYCNLHGLWKAKEPVFKADFNQNDVACSAEFSMGCVDPSRT